MNIVFKGIEYNISVGDILQVKVDNAQKNQTFIVYDKCGNCAYLEVINKISSSLYEVRVKDIVRNTSLDFDSMTKKELVQYIKDNQLDINVKLKKSDILTKLKQIV